MSSCSVATAPTIRPIAASHAPRLNTSRPSRAGSEPRARRTANSRIRDVTVYDITPNRPMAASTSAEHGEQRDQPRIQTHLPERVREHVIHRLDVEDRETRIDLADRGPDQTNQRFRRAVRAHDERHADIARHRHVLRLRVEDLRLGAGRFRPAWRTSAITPTIVPRSRVDADRIFVREIAPRQRLVDDDDSWTPSDRRAP